MSVLQLGALNFSAASFGVSDLLRNAKGSVDLVTRGVERVERLRKSDSFFAREIGSRLALLPVGTSLAIHNLGNGLMGGLNLLVPSMLYRNAKNMPFPVQVLGLYATLPLATEAFKRYAKVVKDSFSMFTCSLGLLAPEYAIDGVRGNGSAAAKKPQPTRLQSIRQAVQNSWQRSSLKVKTVLGYGPKPEGMCKRAYKSVTSLTSDNRDILAGAALVSAMFALAYNQPGLRFPTGLDFF